MQAAVFSYRQTLHSFSLFYFPEFWKFDKLIYLPIYWFTSWKLVDWIPQGSEVANSTFTEVLYNFEVFVLFDSRLTDLTKYCKFYTNYLIHSLETEIKKYNKQIGYDVNNEATKKLNNIK